MAQINIDRSAVDQRRQAAGRARASSSPVPSPLASQDRALDRERKAKDVTARILVSFAFVLAMVPLVSLVWVVIANGVGRLSWSFLTTDMVGIFGGKTGGGVAHAIVGTLIVTLGATVISTPIGLLAAIYLVEYGQGRALSRATTFFVDVMTGIPSIVAGLFGAAVFSLAVGPGYRAGIIGAVALSVLMVPTVVRSSEEMLRLVPNELREASYALGVPKWRTIVKVVLRTSAAGLTTSVMLAIARVIGETAPLLVTVGFIERMNADIFDGRMTTLPVYVYRQYSQGLATCRAGIAGCVPTINYERAWSAALVLIVLVMLLNLIARWIARVFSVKTK